MGIFCWDIPSGYDIHSLPWEIQPFFSSVNHLFLWAMASMAMLKNQRVMEIYWIYGDLNLMVFCACLKRRFHGDVMGIHWELIG